MKITKEEIIEAIVYEPLLEAENFVVRNENEEICSVCAVGAVLRKKITNDYVNLSTIGVQLVKGYCSSSQLEISLLKDNFLSILSCFFERSSDCAHYEEGDYIESEDDRRMLCLFVIEAFCPDEGIEVVV